MSAMSAMRLEMIPEHDIRVRRRRYSRSVVLVCDNHFFEIDDLVDNVWRCCDGRSTLVAISERLAAERGLPAGDAVAATMASVQMLRDIGLLTLLEPATPEVPLT
jgi:coenzyme PQQ synthesis protein D (PqqD)